MSRSHELEAKIFLRSLKDAQFCLYHTCYKKALIEQFSAYATELRKYYDERTQNAYVFTKLESYRLFQFSQYSLDKYMMRSMKNEDTINFENSMSDLDKIQRELQTFIEKKE